MDQKDRLIPTDRISDSSVDILLKRRTGLTVGLLLKFRTKKMALIENV